MQRIGGLRRRLLELIQGSLLRPRRLDDFLDALHRQLGEAITVNVAKLRDP